MEHNRPITLDDLPIHSRPLAACIGVEKFLLLAENFGGEMIYIPSLKHIRAEMRNNDIRTDYYTETPEIEELSRKYCLSTRHIRNIVQK